MDAAAKPPRMGLRRLPQPDPPRQPTDSPLLTLTLTLPRRVPGAARPITPCLTATGLPRRIPRLILICCCAGCGRQPSRPSSFDVQEHPVPSALAAGHHRRCHPGRDGPQWCRAVLRGRTAACGQPRFCGHRRTPRRQPASAHAQRAGAAAAGRQRTPAATLARRRHRAAAVGRALCRRQRALGVFRPVQRRALQCPARASVLRFRRRPASPSRGWRTRQVDHRQLCDRAAVLHPVRALPALATALVALAQLAGGGVETQRPRFSVEPAFGGRHLGAADLPDERADWPVVVIRLVPQRGQQRVGRRAGGQAYGGHRCPAGPATRRSHAVCLARRAHRLHRPALAGKTGPGAQRAGDGR